MWTQGCQDSAGAVGVSRTSWQAEGAAEGRKREEVGAE